MSPQNKTFYEIAAPLKFKRPLTPSEILRRKLIIMEDRKILFATTIFPL
jgi:hypothetical protein